MKEPEIASTWEHVKTGGRYIVIAVAICSTNGERNGAERSVVYRSLSDQMTYYREISEFTDGRFAPLS